MVYCVRVFISRFDNMSFIIYGIFESGICNFIDICYVIDI